MKIMALDISQKTGFSFGERHDRPHCGTIDLPGLDDKNLARSCGGLYSSVMAMVRANKIEGVVIEAPLIGISKKNKRGIYTPTSAHGDRVLTMLSGAAQAAISNGGAKFLGMPGPQTWRAAVLGNGRPTNPKSAALEYCRLVLKLNLDDHNAAEAACILQWAFGQEKQMLWDAQT